MRRLNYQIDSIAFVVMALTVSFASVSDMSAQDFRNVESTFTIFPSLDPSTPATQHVLGMPNDIMTSLSNPSVTKDLEITDSQRSELLAIEKRLAPRFKALLQETLQPSLSRPLQAINSDIQALQKERAKAFGDVLLPQQIERIKQVSAQMRIRSQGIGSVLRSGEVSDELGITSAQKLKIAQIQKELQAELAKEMARLKEAARSKILDVLEPQQRQNFDLLIGEEFKQTQKDWDELSPRSSIARPEPEESPEPDNTNGN